MEPLKMNRIYMVYIMEHMRLLNDVDDDDDGNYD